ncbi:MAG: L,D-transpeptidase [Anaerolineales bacterium]
MNKLRFYSILFLEIGIIIFAGLGLFVVVNPALALMVKTPTSKPAPPQQMLWALAYVPKPSIVTSTPETHEQIIDPSTPTEEASDIGMDIVNDGSVSPGDFPSNDQEIDDGRWIDVNLSQQQIYVYEGETLVNSFIVSTGLPGTPTVTGEYRIYVKVPVQDMSGPGYYLSDVPWVMFFYEDYGFHGTYWHNNFGSPMSRGCVNLTVEDAEWLYEWASVGTRVNIHY